MQIQFLDLVNLNVTNFIQIILSQLHKKTWKYLQ